MVSRNEVIDPAEARDRAKAKARSQARTLVVKPPPPLVLTQVHFTTRMEGRFGTGKDADKTEDRWSDFRGDVETVRARVSKVDDTHDIEHTPDDAIVMTSQFLRVVSEPPQAAAVERDQPSGTSSE